MSLVAQIRTALTTQHNLPPPSTQWLQSLISARNPPPPLSSLIMMAKARLLSSDLTTPGMLESAVLANISFPPAAVGNEEESTLVAGPTKKEVRLEHDVYVQVLDIENVSRSKWAEVEALEAIGRGEQMRGRQVVQLPQATEEEEDDDDGTRNGGARHGNTKNTISDPGGTHKLILQDCQGRKIFAMELVVHPRIAVGVTHIGEKMLLKKGTMVARGMVMLEPTKCVLLGGKIEAWHQSWTEGRLTRLREGVGAEQDARGNR